MIGICPLASGSKGNSVYINTGRSKILIDAGISALSIKKRLFELGADISELDGIFITHEHSDHISGLKGLIKNSSIKIIANWDTAKSICNNLGFVPNLHVFSSGEEFLFQDLSVLPFNVSHDAIDPVGFRITCEHGIICYCSDIGFSTTATELYLAKCNYLYLESNHEPDMVHLSSRPEYYKQRVLGKEGHLSNSNSAALLQKIAHDELYHVYLAHISEECNDETIAMRKAKQALASFPNTTVSIAFQKQISDPIIFADKHLKIIIDKELHVLGV